MEARKLFEEEIMKRVKLLPEAQLARVISLMESLEAEEKKKQAHRDAIEELCGKYRDVLPSSEDFMRRKQEEKKIGSVT